jgi:hypothetical protein
MLKSTCERSVCQSNINRYEFDVDERSPFTLPPTDNENDKEEVHDLMSIFKAIANDERDRLLLYNHQQNIIYSNFLKSKKDKNDKKNIEFIHDENNNMEELEE